jgi:hypothetical protein
MINQYHFDSVKREKTSSTNRNSYQESVLGQIYKLQLNVDFKVKDLKLFRSGNKLVIKGYYECTFHIPIISKKRMKFNTEIEIPQFVDINRISSYIVSDENYNILTIEAPVIPVITNQLMSVVRPQSTTNLAKASSQNRKNSIYDLQRANDINDTVLRYEYNLAQYRPEDIDISVENGHKLIITALSKNYDNFGTFNSILAT